MARPDRAASSHAIHAGSVPTTNSQFSPSPYQLTRRNRSPDRRTSLPRIQALFLQLHHLWALLHDFFSLGQDEFDVAGVRHVWVDL